MDNKLKYSNWQFINDLWYFLRKFKLEFIFLSFLLILASLSALIPPIILAKIIDFFNKGGGSINTFYILIGILLGFGIFDRTFRLFSMHFFTILMYKIQKSVRVESFEKLMEGDLVWHDKENTGNKIQKIMSGADSVGDFISFYLNDGVRIVINFIGIFSVFAFFSLKYALIAGFFCFFYLLTEFLFNKKLVEKSVEAKKSREIAVGKTYEFSSNISTIKYLGLENSSKKQIEIQEDAVMQAQRIKRKIYTRRWLLVHLISVIFYSLFIFLVGRDIFLGLLTLGAIVIYVDYTKRLTDSLTEISSQSTKLIDIKYSIYRLMDIFKTIPKVQENRNLKKLGNWSKLYIKNLNFKYKNEDVLENFNLVIKKGERIGIVGKSGSGKSTLFKLILKLYSPQKGEIYFDNQSLKDIKSSSILSKVSIVPQETELFNMTMKDNITISSEKEINDFKYKNALLHSQLNKVIEKLKDGDLTIIGEKGVRLSGGERQRVGIARAMYKDSEIVIFDEATSNLDYETEKRIIDLINKEFKNKTLIFSAHRLSTLKDMDRIIFLEKGKIIEEGNFNELLRKRGEFYSLWKKQGEMKY